ncbi:23S rRNA (uracil(1939)-C(5))-methyltransferase RlmD [bacterium]|jgi:23S rRNA (uracil1939-C5)-methyltransferase|nr:23S rRNA (uracil(1939)-C(5))-methyltransferase RlmD [bacterium]
MKPSITLRQYDTIKLKIEKIVYQGWGMGRLSNFVIFVPNTLPGDYVSAKIIKKRKSWAQAVCLEIIEQSEFREKAICDKYGLCGGCQILDVSYENQIKLKHKILDDCFTTFLPEEKGKTKPFIQSPQSIYYRNKMEFSFGTSDIDKNKITIGQKKRGDFSTIIPLNKCYLMSDISSKILGWTQSFFTETDLTSWCPTTHKGILRHLIIKRTKNDEQYLINLSVNDDPTPLYSRYAKQLQETFKEVTSVYLSSNKEISDTAFSKSITHLSGNPFLEESLGPLTVRLSPLSFFQTNALLFEALYTAVSNQVPLSKNDTVMDLYCGTGTIGLFLASKVKKVIGIEENPAAIEDAKINASQNNISNIEFMCGRVKNILKFNTFSPDVIVVDPPRSGMVPKALKRIGEIECPYIIYVSCNPVTMARDINDLKAHNYVLQSLQPVDMFPNTFHMETISLLKRMN